MNEKYVKWSHVKELLNLIKKRDSFMDWTSEYEKEDRKVKRTIEWLERNAKEIQKEIDELRSSRYSEMSDIAKETFGID